MIVAVINNNHSKLITLIQTSLQSVAREMYQAKIISEEVKDNPTPDKILKEFIIGMEWIKNQASMEKHCKKFLDAFNKIGGAFIYASETLTEEWLEATKQDMNITLSFDSWGCEVVLINFHDFAMLVWIVIPFLFFFCIFICNCKISSKICLGNNKRQ